MNGLLTVRQVATLLQVHPQSVYQNRQIPRIRIGSRIRFRASQVEQFLKQNTTNPLPVLNNQSFNPTKSGLILTSIQVLITGQTHFIFTHNNCGILSVDNYFFLKGAIHIR
jgi:excisionase family DNA binding protein